MAKTTRSKSPRRPYRPDAAADIARIEAKRARLAVSQAELAARCGMTERSWRRMVSDGRAFPRRIRAARLALRSIEAERRTEAQAFPEGDQ